jgi:SAM-dependent methyltransferase
MTKKTQDEPKPSTPHVTPDVTPHVTPEVPLQPCRACGSSETRFAFHRGTVWLECRDCESVSAVAPADVIDDRGGFDEPGCHLRLTTLCNAVAGLESLLVWRDKQGAFTAYCDGEGIDTVTNTGDRKEFTTQGAFDVVAWYDNLVTVDDLRAELRQIAAALAPGGLLLLETTTRAERSIDTLARATDIRPESGHALIITPTGLHAAMTAAGFAHIARINETTTLWRLE